MRTKQLEDLGYRTFKTIIERDSFLNRPNAIIFENLRCVVYADPLPSNNGVYRVNDGTTWVADASATAAIFDDNYDYSLWVTDPTGGASRRALAEKFDEIDDVLSLLAPEQPNRLDEINGLSISQTAYSGFIAGTNSAITRVLPNNVSDVTFITNNNNEVIYDSTSGNLTFNITNTGFNSEIASITFTENDDTNLSNTSIPNGYSNITITEDEDFYLGQAGQAGFWFGFEASGNINILGNGFTDGVTYNVEMNHSDTGTINSDFKLEDINIPLISMDSNISLPIYSNQTNGTALSGVPSYDTSADFTFNYTANNISKNYRRNNNVIFNTISSKLLPNSFNQNKLNDIAAPELVTMNINPAFTYNPGTAVQINGQAFDILNQVSTDNINFSNVYWDLDSESSRRRESGSADLDTVSANLFSTSLRNNDTVSSNPWDSFVTANELQRINGEYIYPNTDYSLFTPAGPNYSTLIGSRYATFVTSLTISNTDNFILNTNGFSGKLAADFGATDNTGNPANEPNTRILLKVGSGNWLDATLGAGVLNQTLNIEGCLSSNGGTSTNSLRRIQLPGVSSGTISVRYIFTEASSESVNEPTAQNT